MQRLWSYVRPHRARVAWGLLMLALTNATTMAVPYLFRAAIDGVGGSDAVAQLRDIALLISVTAVAGAVFRVLSRVHLFYMGREVEMTVRNDFYASLSRQPRTFFDVHPVGDLMSRATYDLTQVRLLLGPGLLNSANTIVAYASAVPLMFLLSPRLSLISLAVYVPALYLTHRLSTRMYRINEEQQRDMAGLGNFIQEHLGGAQVVRTFGIEARQSRRFAEKNRAYYRSSVQLAWARSYTWRMMAIFASLGVLLVLWVGAGEVMDKRLTLGALVAMVEYLALLGWPSLALGWVVSIVQRGVVAWRRLDEILGTEPAIVSGPEAPAELAPSLSLRDLRLVLDGRAVLDGIELEVTPGKTLGIVGAVGSGKSMVLRSLLREVDVPPASVFVGGVDVTRLSLDRLRAVFGVVDQTPLLFSRTVAENVAFGAPSSTQEAIGAALKLASFQSDLAILPAGLETLVGERGITLSGGQKQRVALARALILEPPILLLDDALANVDAETEQAILAGLRAVRAGRTTVIVAHRISAVQHADLIVVLDQGRVSERGTHATLLSAGGFYAQLARRQQLEAELGIPEEKSA